MLQFIGLLLPPLIDLVNRLIKDSDARFWMSVLICSLVGFGIDLVGRNGLGGYAGMTLAEIVEALSLSAMAVFGMAQITYSRFYDGSNLKEMIRK